MLIPQIRDKKENNIQGAFQALAGAKCAHQKYLINSNKKDLDEAISLYIKAIKLDSSIAEVYYRLAGLLLETKQISVEGAISQCKEAIKLAPKSADAHIYTGYFLSVAGEFEEAQKEFETAIKLNPISCARARIVLAMMLLEKNKSKKNFGELTKSMYYLFSGGLMFLLDSGSLRMIAANVGEDISVLKYKILGKVRKITGRYSSALKTYKTAAKKTGRESVFYGEMADTAIEKENYPIAIDCTRKALVSEPENPELVVKLITLLEEHKEEATEELIDLYTKLVWFNPDFPRCYYELGHLYIKKGDNFAAVNAFQIALEKEPQNPFFHNSLAYAYVQLEQYDDAAEHYKTAIDINPDNKWTSIVCQALGSIYHQIKDNPEAALAVFNTSNMLCPDSAETLSSIADVYFDMNDFDNCIKYYESAIEKDPENPRLYSRIAMIYWEKDEIEKALIYYNKALDLDPEYDIALNNLGVVHLDGLGDPDSALGYFDDALEVNDKYVLAYFNAGRALEAMGQKTEAAKNYQTAIDLNQINPVMDQEDIKNRLWGLFEV